MTSILCLAHYCDIHGPTPLMVTEGLPVPCSICYEHDTPFYTVGSSAEDRPRTSVPSGSRTATAAVTESLRRLDFASSHRSSSVPASEQEAQTYRAALLRSAQLAGTSSAVESPPLSPRRFSEQFSQQQQQKRPDSGFRRTYDEYVTKRAAACDNCALTLPRRQESPDSGNGVDSRIERGATLRTRAPCARVYAGAPDDSPVDSQASSSAASEDEAHLPRRSPHRKTGTTVSAASRSTASTSSAVRAHTHYLDYTSTHEPVSATSFSIVRASCLRTLSLESLPRPPAGRFPGSSGSASSTPVASPVTPAFVTTHSAGAAASGGPIFFGDPSAGYTTAYIFRIPDVHARGHKRVYAFLALSTHRERLAMKSFGFIEAAFRDLAAWILRLAEAEAERANSDGGSSPASSPVVATPGYGGFGTQSEAGSQPVGGGGSSFLTGGMGGLSRRMGAGFGGSGVSLKQRGLPELVGLPDFFIELHTRFVRLLLELGVELGS